MDIDTDYGVRACHFPHHPQKYEAEMGGASLTTADWSQRSAVCRGTLVCSPGSTAAQHTMDASSFQLSVCRRPTHGEEEVVRSGARKEQTSAVLFVEHNDEFTDIGKALPLVRLHQSPFKRPEDVDILLLLNRSGVCKSRHNVDLTRDAVNALLDGILNVSYEVGPGPRLPRGGFSTHIIWLVRIQGARTDVVYTEDRRLECRMAPGSKLANVLANNARRRRIAIDWSDSPSSPSC